MSAKHEKKVIVIIYNYYVITNVNFVYSWPLSRFSSMKYFLRALKTFIPSKKKKVFVLNFYKFTEELHYVKYVRGYDILLVVSVVVTTGLVKNICIHTHTNILKLLKKYSRCMFLPKLLVYYVFLYFTFTTDKRLIHKLCRPFGSSGRMFREEMWCYSRGCLWLLTVNGFVSETRNTSTGCTVSRTDGKEPEICFGTCSWFDSAECSNMYRQNVNWSNLLWCSAVKPLCVSRGNFRRFQNCFWVWDKILNNPCSRAHDPNVKTT
jgi:hypothetical protein